jgi:hypothetical protein
MKYNPKKVREFAINMALLLGTLVALFVLLEAGMRGAIYWERQKSFDTLMRQLPEPKNGTAQHLMEIIQPSRYEGIIYELRPDLLVKFKDVLIETNRQGFRNENFSVAKPPHTARVVFLGDSHMFGWGVAQEKTCPYRLQEMLNMKYPQKRWEVINTAVPGYNTAMEIETLEKKALKFSPDIVIMEFICNDLDLPNFLLESSDRLRWNHLYIFDFIKNKFTIMKEKMALVYAPSSAVGANSFERDPDKVPVKYRGIVGMPAFLQAMEKLKRMQVERHFEVVICMSMFPIGRDQKEFRQSLEDLCKRLQFHLIIDLNRLKPEMVVSNEDRHPNALAHEMKAGVLLNFITNEHLLDRVLAGQ